MNDKEFLSYFEHLASPSTPDKSITSSANSILQTLLALDHNPSATSKPLKPSAFGSHISEDLDYTLIRLIRGMTSQTLKVQFHFALVLKLLLQRFDVILNQNYLDFLLKECNNKAQKSEIPHLIIAKHLGITSLIESRSLSDDTLLSFIFEIVINDIEKYPFIEELGVRVLEIAFYDNYKDKTKRNTSEIKTILKLVANKFKAVNKNDNPNHIRLLLTLSKAYKEFVNTVDFPFKKQLENCLLDYNKLLKLLIKSSEKFPKEPFFISSVVGYIHEYAETQGKKEIWTAFFDYFSKELTDHKEKSSNFDYKKAFLLLDLFKTFLKAEKFEIQMLNLIPDELVTLWLKNLNVQNETLRKISKKIEKILVKLIQKCEKTPENREEILTFVLHMKEGAYYKFSGANPFAKAFFQEVLTGDLIEKYWKFLKKKLSHAQETNYKLYLIGEILHFFEWKLEELQEEKLLEIISMVFKENDEAKIRKTIIKDEDEEIVKQEITKFQEITFDYFYSLLNGVIKRNSEKFSKKKSVIWKGLTKDNRCLLFAILDNCQKHVEMTNKQNKEINNKKFDKLKKNNSLIFQKRVDFLAKLKPLAEDLQSKIEAYSKDLLDKELTKKMIAFITLMASVGLMSFQFPEESFDTLAELLQVYEEMDLITCNKGSKIAKKRKLNDGNEKIVGKNQKAMQVFMDILVSLLAKSPNFLRDTIRRAFREFMEEIDSDVLQILTNVVIRKNDEYLNDMMDEDEDD